jgi:hypothetical protein
MKREISPAARVLAWCVLATLLAHWAIFQGLGKSNEFSAIFRFLLKAYDAHGNAALAGVVLLAFFLRRRSEALALIGLASRRPWMLAAAVFPLLCLGAVFVYEARPVAMDEYAPLLQAQAFAAGRLSGTLPADLLDQLIPRFFQSYFFAVSRASGEVSTTYWPGFALLLAPFAWLGIPWAANPAIGALTIPAVHRLAERVTGSSEAAGWAVAFTLASPVFLLSSISYYAMGAQLLFNVLYALLLLQPSIGRALAAGFIGSIALVLNNPVPHLLFSVVFVVWLLLRGGSLAVLAALLAGYLPLTAVLGVGWYLHVVDMSAALPGNPVDQPASAAARSVVDALLGAIAGFMKLPQLRVLDARLAGASKVWTWAAGGLLVLAAFGAAQAPRSTGLKLLGLAFCITFFGYFLVPFDQGHGWGYRYIHPAWFALPLFAGAYLERAGAAGAALRAMAAWSVVLSLAAACLLRLAQVDVFVERHLAQVPPLQRPASAERPEVVFVDVQAGFYTQDLVQNDAFLRSPRIVMVYPGAREAQALMALRFPGYRRVAQGGWGEHWIGNQTPPEKN